MKFSKVLAKREQIVSFIQSRTRTSLSPEASHQLFTEVADKVFDLDLMRVKAKDAEELATLPESLGKAREIFLDALYSSARYIHDDASHMIDWKVPMWAAHNLQNIWGGQVEKLLRANKPSEARKLATQTLDLARYTRNDLNISAALTNMGAVEFGETYYPKALALYQEAVSVCDRGIANTTKSSWIGALEGVKQVANTMLENVRSQM